MAYQVVTPSHMMGLKHREPVFKTPMTFSPRLVGEQARPSPSRVDVWREQLGLDDDPYGCNGQPDMPSSDEEELEQYQPQETCSMIEYQALKKELEERNSQRDELLYKIKMLNDKGKNYKARLVKEENNKKQQIKIMRKTHESHLEAKQNLVQNLQDVIDEQEAKIFQLEAEIKGDASRRSKPPSAVNKLVDQIQHLESEKAELTGQLLTAQAELQNFRSEKEEQDRTTKSAINKLEKDNRSLQEEVVGLRNSQGNGSTDTEKQLLKLEQDCDRLQRELSESRRLQPKQPYNYAAENAKIKKLEEENEHLKNRVLELETDCAIKQKELSDLKLKHKEDIHRLTSENVGVNKQLRQMRQDLTSQQSKEPQVHTKVEKVEVESEASKKALAEAMAEKDKLRNQITTYQRMYNDSNKQLTAEKIKVTDLEKRLKEYEKQMEVVKSEMMREMKQLEQTKSHAVDQAAKRAEEKMMSLNANYTRAKLGLQMLWPQFTQLVKEHKALKKDMSAFPLLIKQTVGMTLKEISKAVHNVSEYNKELVRKYKKEMQLRKKYHNELVELKGNIRVFCRVRPNIREDGSGQQAQSVVSYDQDDDGLLFINNKGGRLQTFEMDKVFTEDSTQTEVFDEVKALVTCCVDGYNVCIFAYGQTGSGKTYTMEGPSEDPGINQRGLMELFRETADRALEWQYDITVSVMEIYNEMIRDLLSSDPSYKMEVKMSPEGGLYVPGLTTIRVQSVEDINETFALGHRNRATACTNMNEHSSRSHALLCVNVIGRNKTTGAKTVGKLNLVDLAGSERVNKSGADGARLKEAQNINKSLSSLGDVIQSLRNKQAHVPYRNSKLTYLLQDSLGGDSKTLMIVQVAPVEKNVNETLSSLSFAQRVRTVELGMASKKTESSEVADLKERLAQYEGGRSTPTKGTSSRATSAVKRNKFTVFYRTTSIGAGGTHGFSPDLHVLLAQPPHHRYGFSS
ncbi:kinesin-like protein KIFC3 [Lingula anatina]|uniref:Kinesin-like protein n=1 Tax=Lingula anatina TaxID=7574 RepID=A0A1S3IH51_LINAN|nr:kinesin-like protein KIFC3 [Lingula anatina]|eukprot:XP_013396814.1 kinesin-like protein KIFC3 [Lingula anatina]